MGGQGRSKSAPEWPEFGFGAVQRPPNWSMTPEMDQKWFPKLPLIDLSPFPRAGKWANLAQKIVQAWGASVHFNSIVLWQCA